MTPDDIVSGLEGLRALVRDPVTGTYALRLDYTYYREYIEKWEAKKYVCLNPEALTWTPYIIGRSNLAHLEHAPPLVTLAPRDEEGEADVEQNRPEPGVRMEIVKVQGGEKSGDAMVNGDENDKMDIDLPTPSKPVLTPSTDTDKPILTENHSGPMTNITPGPPPKTPVSKPPSSSPYGPNNVNSISLTPSSSALPPPIPPTRFEIFPPLPGTATRRKAGRPVGSFRKRAGTPASVSRRRDTKSGSGGYDGVEDGSVFRSSSIGRSGGARGKSNSMLKRNSSRGFNCMMNESIALSVRGDGKAGQDAEEDGESENARQQQQQQNMELKKEPQHHQQQQQQMMAMSDMMANNNGHEDVREAHPTPSQSQQQPAKQYLIGQPPSLQLTEGMATSMQTGTSPTPMET